MMAKISPSMMCAGIADLADCLRDFEETGVEYLHIDLMDGDFVPNLALGIDYIKNLRELTAIPLDIHMMVVHPEEKIDWCGIHPGEYVSVHVESTPHLQRILQKIRSLGGNPMRCV